jgi:hypothetical protein
MPRKTLRVPRGWDSQISRHSAHEGGKVSPTHRPPLPQGNSPGTHLCLSWVDPRTTVRLQGLCKWKKYNNTIGNRTRDLPACSAMPQPTASPCARKNILAHNKYTCDWWRFNSILMNQKAPPPPPHLSSVRILNQFLHTNTGTALLTSVTSQPLTATPFVSHHLTITFWHTKLQKVCIIETASLKQSISLPESRKRLKAKFRSFK